MPKTNHLTPLGGYSDAGAKKLRQMAENAAVLTEFLRFQGRVFKHPASVALEFFTQKPDATFIATAAQWEKAGFTVTAGSDAIRNVNIRNSAIVSDKYKDYGFLICTAYNYHYLAEDEQVYETGETVIEHCSVSHSSITVKLPEPEADENEPAVTTMEVVPPDVIEYDEDGNIIEPEDEPVEPTKHAEHCIGAITGIGDQIDGCYVTDFGIFNELSDYYLYCGGISGKPASVTDSAVYYYSAQGNIFNAGGVVGSAAGARAFDAKGRELPDSYGGSIQGCLARNNILKTETSAGGISAN